MMSDDRNQQIEDVKRCFRSLEESIDTLGESLKRLQDLIHKGPNYETNKEADEQSPCSWNTIHGRHDWTIGQDGFSICRACKVRFGSVS